MSTDQKSPNQQENTPTTGNEETDTLLDDDLEAVSGGQGIRKPPVYI